MKHGNGGMGNTIESIGFHGRVMNHVFEDHLLAYLQFMIKTPVAHEIAAQAAVATQTIEVSNLWRVLIEMLGATHLGIVRHLQTIGHVAGEADIKDSSLNALVLHHIHYVRNEWPSLPGKGTSRLKYHLQPRIALVEFLHQRDEQTGNPLQLREPPRELSFDMRQRALEHVCPTLAMAVTMEALDILRQLLWQLVGRDTEPCTRGTGVIEQRFHLGIFGIHA